MRKIKVFLLAAAVAASLAGTADAAEPERRPGEPAPWETDIPTMSGDRWATLFIDIDRTGKALNCRIGRNNIANKDMRFYMCRAVLLDFRTDPIVRNGVAVPGTIERKIMMRGPAGRRAVEKARKRYLAEHPEAPRR
jgi:hypothetical protein